MIIRRGTKGEKGVRRRYGGEFRNGRNINTAERIAKVREREVRREKWQNEEGRAKVS
jgi:hypothetical protein